MSTSYYSTVKSYLKVNRLLVFGLAAMLLLTACGGGESADSGDLGKKKEKLAELKTQRKALNTEIRTLEKEIGELDTNAVTDTRVPVKVMEVKETTFEHYVNVQGSIEANNNVMVSPQSAGMITQIKVKEGQNVKRGQLLGRLDDDILRRSLEELDVQLELADTVYSRQKNLWAQKIGSEIQLLQAKTQKEGLEKRIATTREQLDLMEIRSPISGVVEKVMPKVGEVVAPGMPAFNILNLSSLSFKADISEAYIPYIKRGDKVSIHFPVIGKTVESKVATVSQNINPINRTVAIEVNLPGGDKMLKANLSGEIAINDVNRENSIVIPVNQIQSVGDKEFVMVAVRGENGEYLAKKVEVTTGISYQGDIEVLSGLGKGSQLIVEGAAGLNEGAQVLFSN